MSIYKKRKNILLDYVYSRNWTYNIKLTVWCFNQFSYVNLIIHYSHFLFKLKNIEKD